MAHALLAPSAASRWLVCTPSARLEAEFPDRAGKAAEEGTLAHSLSEVLILHRLNRVSEIAYKGTLKILQENDLYTEAMLGHCDDYAVFVLEAYNEALQHTKDAILLTEEKVDLGFVVPESFGTVDNQIIADGTLHIIDLKYGKGVLVDAENNRQMMLYALGVIREHEFMYDIQKVKMAIYQPRIDNYSSWEISVEDLKKWGEEELKPKAEMAFKGEGEFIAGKHCQFCKVRANCKANADLQLEIAKHDFKEPVLLDDAAIADILSRMKMFEGWLTAVDEYALDQSVNHGKKWPGFKLVEGRSNRKYSDIQAVATTLTKAGYKEDTIYEKKLLGITAMEAEITKKTFNNLLSELVIKPQGKPTLVPESDKRPALNSLEAATDDFKNL
jgi:hypothetical protein